MARPFEIAENVGDNTKVTSPYNFVEPAPKVGITPWVEEEGFDAPSHDVPLPSGLCGELTIDWTFERQFLIGGAEKVDKVTKQAILRNSAGQDEMILPGASLRGMSRNVLEIITGARMIHLDREARFSFRDFSNQDWKRAVYPNDNVRETSHFKAGMLIPASGAHASSRNPQGWRLVPAEFARIENNEAVQALGFKCGAGFFNLTVEKKWAELKDKNVNPIKQITCNVGDRTKGDAANWQQANPINIQGHNKHRIINPSKKTGIVSFQGAHTNPRAKNTSQLFFYDYDLNADGFAVPPIAMKQFFQSFGSASGGGALDVWCPKERQKGSFDSPAERFIPVLYIHNSDTSINEASPQEFFLGFTRFLRLPYKYSVGQKIPHADDPASDRLDFVQALFGHVPPDDVALNPADHQTQAWKSRVFFGHASLKQEDKTGSDLKRFEIKAVTQSPRASFGAYYLRPKPGKNPREIGWSDPNVQMAGYKRYPVSRSLRPFSENQGNQANNAGSAMEFVTGIGGNENMPVEVTFTSKIKLHNLHPLELGGLLWMLGWGQKASADTNNQYRHQLGRGKPQGYGVVRAEVDYKNSRIVENCDGKTCANNSDFCNALIEQFESWLSHTFDEDNGRKVCELPHVASLMAMANPDIGDKINEHLRYPTSDGSNNPLIDGHKAIKQESKNTTKYLWRYPEE